MLDLTMLKSFQVTQWDEHFSKTLQNDATETLENGGILYFPQLAFKLSTEEQTFLSSDYADPHAKNISYHPDRNRLCGVQHLTDKQHIQLKTLLDRFSRYAYGLVTSLFPIYTKELMIARTSYRPVQISGRKTSLRKDDKRLHVDAFPSAPNQGKRIIRVFSNINPHGEDRVWRVGEPFEHVAKQFLPGISKPIPGTASLLRLLKITKSYRTLYDYYMLKIHDRMKLNEHYQSNAHQEKILFPFGSSWIVQTDQVSHAAMQGQFALEQTFYLPVTAMADEKKSPLRILENLLNANLT